MYIYIYVYTGVDLVLTWEYGEIWGFPRVRGTILGVPIIGAIVYCGLYLGSVILGDYHIGSSAVLCPVNVFQPCFVKLLCHIFVQLACFTFCLQMRRPQLSVRASKNNRGGTGLDLGNLGIYIYV